jgi:hypothetical protein
VIQRSAKSKIQENTVALIDSPFAYLLWGPLHHALAREIKQRLSGQDFDPEFPAGTFR